MSDYWKLDIKDYTINELDDMFNLTTPYTLEHIVNADNDLTEKIKIDASIDANKNAYLLSTIRKRKLRKIERKDKEKVPIAQGIWLKPEIFRICGFLINDIANKRRLKVNYTNFKELDEQQIATKMNAEIESLDGNYNLGIKLSKLKINKWEKCF